jgi:hypothetical protein
MDNIVIFEVNLGNIYNINNIDFSLLVYWVMSEDYIFPKGFES